MIKIPEEHLKNIYEHALGEYPKECCGMILTAETGHFVRVRRCENVQDIYHKNDPDRFKRTANNGYFIEPKELLSIQKENRERGESIKVIYHSHIDSEAYFSDEDQRMAVTEGFPTYPDTFHLVVSVYPGEVRGHEIFHWNDLQKKYTLYH